MKQPVIEETAIVNSTTGCEAFNLTISVKGTNCPVSFIPGIKSSCEESCSIVRILNRINMKEVNSFYVLNINNEIEHILYR